MKAKVNWGVIDFKNNRDIDLAQLFNVSREAVRKQRIKYYGKPSEFHRMGKKQLIHIKTRGL
jgi:hypothetical protein